MKDRVLRIGHMGLLDAAPLIEAARGPAAGAGGAVLDVHRELGDAALLGRLADRRLDGACLPVPLAVLAMAGIGHGPSGLIPVAFLSRLALGIVVAPRSGTGRGLRIGACPAATGAEIVVRRWGASVKEEPSIRPVAVTQALAFLVEGAVDGLCVPEPVASIAVAADLGSLVLHTADGVPALPGSVLVVRSEEAAAVRGLRRRITVAREACAEGRAAGVIASLAEPEAWSASGAGMPCPLPPPAAESMLRWAPVFREAETVGPAAVQFLEAACVAAAGGRAAEVRAAVRAFAEAAAGAD